MTAPVSPTPEAAARPFRPAPADAHRDPIIFPLPNVARRAALLVAKLPGGDAYPARRVEEIDAICDTHRLAETDRGVLIWRECIGWTSVMPPPLRLARVDARAGAFALALGAARRLGGQPDRGRGGDAFSGGCPRANSSGRAAPARTRAGHARQRS